MYGLTQEAEHGFISFLYSDSLSLDYVKSETTDGRSKELILCEYLSCFN